jgi:hypothetical protein
MRTQGGSIAGPGRGQERPLGDGVGTASVRGFAIESPLALDGSINSLASIVENNINHHCAIKLYLVSYRMGSGNDDNKITEIEQSIKSMQRDLSQSDARAFRYLTWMAPAIATLFTGAFAFTAVAMGVQFFTGQERFTLMQKQIEDELKRLDNRTIPDSVELSTDDSSGGNNIILGSLSLLDNGVTQDKKHTFVVNIMYQVKMNIVGHGTVDAVGIWRTMRGKMLPILYRTTDGVDRALINDVEKRLCCRL